MIRNSIIKLFIFFLFSFTFSDDYVNLKKNITSLLNTTDLIQYNNHIIVSTSGGVYSINDPSLIINNDSDITSMEINNDKLYISSSFPGRLYVYDNNFYIESFIEYPNFDQILDIVFIDNFIFAIGIIDQNFILIQYSINESNQLQYLNYFDSFPIVFESINDLCVFNDILYLATSNGLLSIDYLNDILSLSNSWDVNMYNLDLRSIVKNQRRIFPVCVKLEGEYDIDDCYLGVPVVLGSNGIEKVIELKLNSEEKKLLEESRKHVKEVMSVLENL